VKITYHEKQDSPVIIAIIEPVLLLES